jgi:repressor LexA
MHLTTKQQVLLDYIIQYNTEHNNYPTLSEAQVALSYSHIGSIQKLVQKLVEKGEIHYKKGVSRGISLSSKHVSKAIDVPLLGTVAAGSPILSEENVIRMIATDSALLAKNKHYFWLTVIGDSMIDAHILEGDHVLVESSKTAKNGQIVIAELHNEVTIKRLSLENGSYFLKAENKAYKNIYPSSEASIQGVVVSVFRSSLN